LPGIEIFMKRFDIATFWWHTHWRLPGKLRNIEEPRCQSGQFDEEPEKGEQ